MKKYLLVIIVFISAVTILTGLTQVLTPRFGLGVVGTDATSSSSFLFGIIGMFMVLFGGLMLHTIYSVVPGRPAVLWCALQKLGASAAVSLGIIYGIFSILAAAVAVFDLFSGLIFLYYFKSLNPDEVL